MIANGMYQGTITGVTNLVEERENDFTAELFVAPISRFSVLLGKLIGSGVAAMVSLVGIIAMIVIMQIPMQAGDLLRMIALTPVLALAGGALGVFFIGLTQDQKTVAIGVPLLIFPQMFLSGALIPVAASTGILGFLAKIIPMTYSIDLARNIFYMGKPEYRRGGPPPDVVRRAHHGRVLPVLHGGRDDPVRPGRPQPLTVGDRPCRFRRDPFVTGSKGDRGTVDRGPSAGDGPMADARVIHFEIVGKDQGALQRYYGNLFGWKLNTDFPGGYGMTDPAQTGLIVGVGSTPDGSAGHVTGYVTVDDIDATLAKAVDLGGAVIMPKFSPDGNAQLALVADPEGHILGLTQM